MTYSHTHHAVALALGTALLGALLVPTFSHAQMLSQGSFCNNLDQLKERTMERHTNRVQAYGEARGDQEAQYQERKTERVRKLEENRSNADNARNAGYARLEGLVGEYQAEVDAYRARVEAAVQVRRAAIDDAIGTFENRTRELWDERQANADEVANGMRADMEGRFEDAERACRSDDPGTVRSELRKGLADVGNSYRERTRTQSNRDEYQEAQRTMRAASEAAWEAFRAEAGAARAELRRGLGAQ